MTRRVFLIVLDSLGIGNAPDAALFGDEGSNTLAAVCSYSNEPFPNLAKMGLFNIDQMSDIRIKNFINAQKNIPQTIGSYGRLREISNGKDSTIGHWELSGIITSKPLPVYPNGFPKEIVNELEQKTGHKCLCNKPYSGTKVIDDYAEEHIKTGALILYTSADSVLQIAAHEDVVPIEKLYEYCKIARKIMCGPHAVGRVIARPFIGTKGNYQRTSNRHDFSLLPPTSTMLDVLQSNGFDVISIGKINDIFAGEGITKAIKTTDNTDGIKKFIDTMDSDFNGLCFLNLVDFDMKYGHRNDIKGYNLALHEFDDALGTILSKMKSDDLLIITADHGCDPSTISTDHSRETVPLLVYGQNHAVPQNLGELIGFNHVSSLCLNSLMSEDVVKDFAPDNRSVVPTSDNIFSYVDMTNLKVTATDEDIWKLIDHAIIKKAASVCISPSFVRKASDYAAGRIRICTVIGFPNGYNTLAVKLFEARDAINNGALEIDMVINQTLVKNKEFDTVFEEINELSKLCHSKGAILKVIIETCNLTNDEKVILCDLVTKANADFIKTSTGFGAFGATLEDVALLRKNIGEHVKVKAAGGIRTIDTAKAMINNGADRIGASNLTSTQ